MQTFDEREAIRLELKELIDQKRMDYDLYLESRKIRNDRTTELLNRLRDLDGNQSKAAEAPVLQQPPKKENEFRELMGIKPEKTIVEKEREYKRNNSSRKKHKASVPLERVSQLITNYLIENGPSGTKAIQKFVEEETNGTWNNFSNPIIRTMELYGKVKRKGRGVYYYDKNTSS